MKRIFLQTLFFSKKLSSRGGDALLERIEEQLLKDPESGDLIQGTGGVRKMRIADSSRGKGKRGGYRVIYLDLPHLEKIILITFYGKDEADDLSTEGKRVISELVKQLKGEK
jgi:mRNA-degrading endonuclease RelE of RelBE toxin-antitoxin system